MKQDFQTPGYEDMELSTQIIIAEAIKRGVKVEVLDRVAQFIRLKKDRHVEHVESATKTSRDSYVTSEILGNKTVTKILLKEAGISVPDGRTYESPARAMEDENKWIGKKGNMFVVKPKSTNYGIGVHIMDAKTAQTAYQKAVRDAFQFGDSVIVEEFIPGNEYRFLVIRGKNIAVLNRVPANVTGDGTSTVRQLVDKKNSDPRRGKGYRTPLEKIVLGTMEKQVLKKQGLSPASVPKKGRKIFLRKNSNISTGGDSIDFTDQMHPTYRHIAEKAAKVANANICGVDMIIFDSQKPASKKNHGIIELNYNPVLYFHNFPFEGKNRNTGKYVLDLLGF